MPFPFILRTCFIYQAEFVLIYMVLYWPNFSLMFLIHLFLYAGVYCIEQATCTLVPLFLAKRVSSTKGAFDTGLYVSCNLKLTNMYMCLSHSLKVTCGRLHFSLFQTNNKTSYVLLLGGNLMFLACVKMP